MHALPEIHIVLGQHGTQAAVFIARFYYEIGNFLIVGILPDRIILSITIFD